MSLRLLPKFEMFEEGSQIRRSAKSVRSLIVEGYGRRRYKAEYVKYLTCAHAECDETIDHLETLHETKSLTADDTYGELHDLLTTLSRKLNLFTQSVIRAHESPK